MSFWPTAQAPIRRNSRVAKLLLAIGMYVSVVFAGLALADDGPDTKRPLPKTDEKRAEQAAKFAIPDRTTAAIFVGRPNKQGDRDGGIQNFRPVATEKENSDEYLAWNSVVSHAKQFSTADLEQFAARDLTRDDLINVPNPTKHGFLLELVRFDGKLTRVRWVKATKSLTDFGTSKVYEAQFVPVDEPPNAIMSIVFTELPAELAAVDQKAEAEWLSVSQDITAAGYFFKIAKDAPGPEFPDLPILIGHSITIRKAGTPSLLADGKPEDPIVLDKNLRVFRHIKDDAFIATADRNWEEASAWNRVLLHARRFTPEQLEAAAAERKFADLFTDGRRDYKLDLVKFEGRLIMLNKMKATEKLQAAGLEWVYEGWIVPKTEPSGNPICVVFTDPIGSLEEQGITGRVNKWVTFAGYSFKLMRYKSGERDKDKPSENVVKRTPLILGRAAIERRDPDGPSPVSWSGNFVPAVTTGIVLLIAFGLGVNWWFRRGDKKALKEIDNHRGKNPFGDPGPAVS
ncbi:MAG: hypothetical protein U0792_19210 [Gemmataceae bacterium]